MVYGLILWGSTERAFSFQLNIILVFVLDITSMEPRELTNNGEALLFLAGNRYVKVNLSTLK